MNTHILISCVTIFFCRILDVSLGTIRTVLTVKEKTVLAAVIGFMEVFIWYLVVKDALTGDTPALLTAISYAGGYATGTYVGGRLANALVGGQVTMEVVTSSRNPDALAYLRSFGYGLTVLNVEAGRDGVPKYLILSTIEDYHKAYQMYLARRKKSVFGLQKYLVAEFEKQFKITKTDTFKLMAAMRDDRLAEEKSKRAAQLTAKAVQNKEK